MRNIIKTETLSRVDGLTQEYLDCWDPAMPDLVSGV